MFISRFCCGRDDVVNLIETPVLNVVSETEIDEMRKRKQKEWEEKRTEEQPLGMDFVLKIGLSLVVLFLGFTADGVLPLFALQNGQRNPKIIDPWQNGCTKIR